MRFYYTYNPFKFSGIKYSRKMLRSDSAVTIHLIKIAELARKLKVFLVYQTYTERVACLPLPFR